MDLALLELPARWNRVEEALADVDRLLATGPRVDLALLPEASLTGYASPAGGFDLTPFAEPMGGPTTEAVARLARAHGTAIAAPLVELSAGALYNAFVVISADGATLAHYRKRHPWYPETWAAPGDLPMPVFRLAGLTLTLAICFDVHFLARERARELEAADVLLFPSAWVEEESGDSRAPIFDALRSRFHVTIANANWGVGSPPVVGQGGSRVVLADGRTRRLAPASAGARRLDVALPASV